MNNITNNYKINQFNILYDNHNDSELFYCNRFDLPLKNAYIKDEYCNNKKDFSVIFEILFLIIYSLKIYFYKLYNQLLKD